MLPVRLVNRLKTGFAALVVLVTAMLVSDGQVFSVPGLVLVSICMLLSGTVMLSVRFAVLNTAAVALARVTGILSVFALIFLIAAGTLGGGFNLSSDNLGVAVLMALLSLTGLSALLWPHAQMSGR